MRIISWNVNGLRSIYKKGLLDWVQEVQPDILCLQETKASPEVLKKEMRSIPGYQAFFSSAQRKGYSGVALYSRQEPERVEHGLGIEAFDNEGRVVIATYADMVLYNVYFPNGKSSPERLEYKMDFYETFLAHAKERLSSGKRVVVCGDVNTAHTALDLARPKENEKVSGFLPDERAWIDRFLAAGFVDTFRAVNGEGGNYTWWDMKSRARERNVGWRIDYFFIDRDGVKLLKDAFIMTDVTGSDHCPIGIEIN